MHKYELLNTGSLLRFYIDSDTFSDTYTKKGPGSNWKITKMNTISKVEAQFF